MTDHTTFWLKLPPDHPVLAAARFTEPTSVPLFLDGQSFLAFQRTRKADVTPRALVLGALLHARDEVPGVDVGPLRDHLWDLLTALARGLGEPDTESLVTQAAAVLREGHGPALSRRALENAVGLYPSLHRARSDLIVELWMEALRAPLEERRERCAAVLHTFRQTEREDLLAGPRAFLCYAAIAASAVCEGVSEARELLCSLDAELAAGDEGELRPKIEAFLRSDRSDMSLLDVALE